VEVQIYAEFGCAGEVVTPQAVPEHLDAVEHLRRAAQESVLVEAGQP